MYIRAIEVHGFRDLPDFQATGLGRRVRVQGPGPAATALGDALSLFFAALEPAALGRWLGTMGLLGPAEAPEILGEPHPEQARWTHRRAAQDLLDPGGRDLRIRLDLAIDPPLFRTITEHAGREPRLLAALGAGADLGVGLSFLFAQSFDAMAIHLDRFEVGGERFPTAEADRPPWMRQALRALVGRLHRAEAPDAVRLAERAAAHLLARDRFGAYLAWQAALRPQLGTLRPCQAPGEAALLLADELPLRRLGPDALRRAALAAEAWLHDSDVLFVDDGPEWIESAIEGEPSALEQVFRVCPEGELRAGAPRPSTLPLRARREEER